MPPSDLGCDTPSVGCESPPSELGCATTPSCRGEAAAWGVNHGECKSGAGLSGAMSSESTTGPTEAAVSIAVASEVITLDWKKRSVDNRCCKEYVMDRTKNLKFYYRLIFLCKLLVKRVLTYNLSRTLQ